MRLDSRLRLATAGTACGAEAASGGSSSVSQLCCPTEASLPSHVGKIRRVNPHVWEVLLAGGLLPVMACLAVDEGGQIYNVNADSAAVACATHWKADSLLFLTDVDGVRDVSGARIARLAAEEIPALLATGAVSAGMLAKLNAVREAAAGGVRQVHICNGHRESILEQALRAADGSGPDPGSGTVINAVRAAARIL